MLFFLDRKRRKETVLCREVHVYQNLSYATKKQVSFMLFVGAGNRCLGRLKGKGIVAVLKSKVPLDDNDVPGKFDLPYRFHILTRKQQVAG